MEKRGKAKAKAKAKAHASSEPEVFLTPREDTGKEDSHHRHRSFVLLASGDLEPQEQKLTPYVKVATKKVTAKTGEEQNTVSYLMHLVIGFIALQILVLFTVFCCTCNGTSEGHSSPAAESVGHSTAPRAGEPKADDEGQPSPTPSSSIPSTRNRDNDARYRRGTSLADDILKGHLCADMLKQKAMNAEVAFPERYMIVPQPAIPLRIHGLVRVAHRYSAQTCAHPSGAISKQGSNHHCHRRRCVACGTLLAGKK